MTHTTEPADDDIGPLLKEAAEKLLANTVIENYRVELLG